MARCRPARSAPRISCTIRPPRYRWNVGNALQQTMVNALFGFVWADIATFLTLLHVTP